jgi:hypothetical protein
METRVAMTFKGPQSFDLLPGDRVVTVLGVIVNNKALLVQIPQRPSRVPASLIRTP